MSKTQAAEKLKSSAPCATPLPTSALAPKSKSKAKPKPKEAQVKSKPPKASKPHSHSKTKGKAAEKESQPNATTLGLLAVVNALSNVSFIGLCAALLFSWTHLCALGSY